MWSLGRMCYLKSSIWTHRHISANNWQLHSIAKKKREKYSLSVTRFFYYSCGSLKNIYIAIFKRGEVRYWNSEAIPQHGTLKAILYIKRKCTIKMVQFWFSCMLSLCVEFCQLTVLTLRMSTVRWQSSRNSENHRTTGLLLQDWQSLSSTG